MSVETGIAIGLTGLTALLFKIGLELREEEDPKELQLAHFGAGYLFFLGTTFTLGKLASRADMAQVATGISGIFWIALVVFAVLVMWTVVQMGRSVLQRMADEYPED